MIWVLPVVWLPLLACSTDEYSVGERGQVQLEVRASGSYGVGDECFIACGFDRPFLRGTEETIQLIEPDAHPRLRARALDPGVVRITEQSNVVCATDTARYSSDSVAACDEAGGFPERALEIDIKAIATGEARIVFTTEDGAAYDWVDLSVRDAVTLRIEQQMRHGSTDWSYDPVQVIGFRNGTTKLHVLAYDQRGNRLQASTGMQLVVEDAAVASFGGESTTSSNSHVEVIATGPGTTYLVTSSGAATTSALIETF
jgi:hypothetical protein